MVVSAQFQQPGIEVNLIAAALQHCAFQIVVKNHAGLSAPVLEGVDVATQEILRRLIEEEFQIESAGVGQRDHEAGQRSAGAADHDIAEVGPIGLRLVGGKGPQTQKGFPDPRPQVGNGAAQLHDAAGIAAVVNHLVNARGAQAGMLVQGLPDELDIGIGERGAQWLRALKTLRFNGGADGVGMNAQFMGDGADRPMLGVKVAANFDAGFWRDHQWNSLSFWNGRERIDETSAAAAEPAAQPQTGPFFRLARELGLDWRGAKRPTPG